MTKEEILKAAQENASKEGEAEKAAFRRAVVWGSIVGIVFCMITFVIKMFLHKTDFIEFAILLLFGGTINLYYGKKCKDKKSFVTGIIELVLGALFFILFIGAMFI